MNQVFLGDCTDVMPKLDAKSIDLVLTSPPYDSLRDYNNTLDWSENVWMCVIREIFRVLKDGGVCVWIVGDATVLGSETGTSFRQALYFMETGFKLHDTMIWNKGSFTATGSLRYRYAPVFEYMFVFVKGDIKTFNAIKDRRNKHGGKTVNVTIRQKDGSLRKAKKQKIIAEYGQRYNIWDIAPEKTNPFKHPAPFPESLVHDIIISWTNQGDVILDPLAGSGTVGKVANDLHRQWVLIEKCPAYVDIIKRRLCLSPIPKNNP